MRRAARPVAGFRCEGPLGEWSTAAAEDQCSSKGASTDQRVQWFRGAPVGSVTGRRSVAEGPVVLVKALTK